MMGCDKVLTTTTPERQVWGPYNLKMGTAFFVNLEELGMDAFEKNVKDINHLITDPTMNVGKKYVDDCEIESFHRFWLSTNQDNPVPTTDSQRRYAVFRASDELCVNGANALPDAAARHVEWAERILKDSTAWRDYYDLLMSLGVKQHMTKADIPMTEYQRSLNESNRDLIVRFVASLAAEAWAPAADCACVEGDSVFCDPCQTKWDGEGRAEGDDGVTLQLTPNALYERFKVFCRDAGEAQYPNKGSFTSNLGRKKLAGVSDGSTLVWDSGEHKMVRKWSFDLVKLREVYGAETAGAEEEAAAAAKLEWQDYERAAWRFLMGEDDDAVAEGADVDDVSGEEAAAAATAAADE